jgi:hypothetical protein
MPDVHALALPCGGYPEHTPDEADPWAIWRESRGLEASVFRYRLKAKRLGRFGVVRTWAVGREGASLVRAGRMWRPAGLGVTPGAWRAASRGGARSAHLRRLPRPYRRPAHRAPRLARLVPLLAGGSA